MQHAHMHTCWAWGTADVHADAAALIRSSHMHACVHACCTCDSRHRAIAVLMAIPRFRTPPRFSAFRSGGNASAATIVIAHASGCHIAQHEAHAVTLGRYGEFESHAPVQLHCGVILWLYC